MYQPPVGGFSFDNCRRCDPSRGRVRGGIGSAGPESALGHGLVREVQSKGERRGLWAAARVTQGNRPERGFLLRPGLLSHFPSALGHPPSPAP